MKTAANLRIQWLHDEISRGSYPNAARLAERFHMSLRQAQRDIDYLKKQLHAPITYDQRNQGYHYTAPFALPVVVAVENDDLYAYTRPQRDPFSDDGQNLRLPEADHVIIQTQIPYTATIAITDKLTVLEMRSYIISKEKKGQYLCEFHNIDRFLCAILTARKGIRIVEPEWLREKLIHMAKKVIAANPENQEE